MPEPGPESRRKAPGRSLAGWRRLGAAGWHKLRDRQPQLAVEPPPPEFREQALAWWRKGQPIAVPGLGLVAEVSGPAGRIPGRAVGPRQPLVPVRFAVA
jgi:hypothetical protein